MAYWTGPSHQMVQTQAAWIKTIEEASGGNLVIELDKAALAKTEGPVRPHQNGVRDMVWAVPGYTVGRFDLLQAAELPLLCPNPTVCSPVLWKWYTKNGLADKEFTDTKLITTFVGGPFQIHTAKPVKTLEESGRSRSAPPARACRSPRRSASTRSRCRRPRHTRRCSAAPSTARCFPGRRCRASASTSWSRRISKCPAASAYLGLRHRRQHQGDSRI